MGRYLVIDDKENNSKRISYLTAFLIRKLIKNENIEEGWALSPSEIATIIANIHYLMEDRSRVKAFFEENKNEYWASCSLSSSDSENLMQIIFNIFSNILAEAMLCNKKIIHIYWE